MSDALYCVSEKGSFFEKCFASISLSGMKRRVEAKLERKKVFEYILLQFRIFS